jgi:hypothetical protein
MVGRGVRPWRDLMPRRSTALVASLRRLATLAAAVLLVVALTGASASSAKSPAVPKTSRELAELLMKTKAVQFMTGPARIGLRYITGGDHSLMGGDSGPAAARQGAAPLTAATPATPSAGLGNIRVNDPSLDTFVDQTTQSETTIGVSGQHVVVGYNDSQQGLLFLTAGANLTGYSYSSDGGTSFKDGGTLPNKPGSINLGDPWLGTDRSGRFYYSTLLIDGTTFNLNVGVGTSTDGGRTFAAPKNISPADEFSGDKDALAVGRDPQNANRDNVYISWDNFGCGDVTCFTGLPLATSTDHGATWTTTYIDKFEEDFSTCSFQQYIGAYPMVDPANGTLYVAAERISVDDPLCEGGTVVFEEDIFKSTNGGQTWGPRVKIGDVDPASAMGAIDLGPAMLMRTIEFPVLAVRNGKLYAAWNAGSDPQSTRSHIRFAKSNDGGQTWALSWATSGNGDEVQPALSADEDGLHLFYYHRNQDNTLDAIVADSSAGASWSPQRVTTKSFPGVFTAPQFDPIIAGAYMGDYVSIVSSGGRQYFAWGDNRDKVVNQLWPSGRNDPNVYFARR